MLYLLRLFIFSITCCDFSDFTIWTSLGNFSIFNIYKDVLFYISLYNSNTFDFFQVLSITKYRIWTTVWAAWHVIWLCLDPVFLHLQHLLPDKEWLFQLTHIVYIILTLHAILDCVASFKIKIYQSSGKRLISNFSVFNSSFLKRKAVVILDSLFNNIYFCYNEFICTKTVWNNYRCISRIDNWTGNVSKTELGNQQCLKETPTICGCYRKIGVVSFWHFALSLALLMRNDIEKPSSVHRLHIFITCQ